MILTNDERDAREGRKIVLAVNHDGLHNLCGPIVSIGLALDYTKLSSKVIEIVSEQGLFNQDNLPIIKEAIKAVGTYTISAAKLNEIQDINIAAHMADYNALMGLIFDVFKVYGNDPDIIQTRMPIKEIVRNTALAMYRDNSAKSAYIMREEWTQFDNLIPNTKIKVQEEDTFSLLFAKAMASTVVNNELMKAAAKYPGYDFTANILSDAQKKVLTEKGMTEYHRAFLPEFSGFTFSKRILI